MEIFVILGLMFNIFNLSNTNNGDIMYYLNCFFVYSILGYVMETFLAFITKSGFKSGILFGPWTPIYGIGTVVILLLSNYFFINLHMPRWLETIIVFFVVAIFLSCLELIGGILIEKILHLKFWSYSHHKYNIGSYISIEMTFVWGIATILFIYVINPILSRFIKMIPQFITIILIFLTIIDFGFTFYKNLKK